MSFNRVQQWATFGRTWWLYDARWQCPFKSAPVISKYLHGRHKPIYHPLSDTGDHVVVINTKEIAMESDYWRTWKHIHHTGYPGGFTETRAYQVHDLDPTEVLRKAVYKYQKGTLIRRAVMARLHLFADDNLPEDIAKNISAQIRQVLPVPKRLDEYTAEEREEFPRLFDWPKDYVMDYGHRKPTDGKVTNYGQKDVKYSEES